jgi:rare lipoprotein A
MHSLLSPPASLAHITGFQFPLTALITVAVLALGFQGCGTISRPPERDASNRASSPPRPESVKPSSQEPQTHSTAPKIPVLTKIPSPSDTSPTPIIAKLPSPSRPSFLETGLASWYGPGFHGRTTASGEIFNQDKFTAAHRTLPWGSRVKVTNLANGKSVIVQINDRGPAVKSRIIDLSRAAARTLGMIEAGTTTVQLEWLSAPEKLGELVSDGR